MRVSDVMATDIVTVDAEAALDEAVGVMLANGVGSVIVVRDGSPTGILTETDSMSAGLVTDRPFSEITVERVMSSPLETTRSDRTLRHAVGQMREEGVKKLPVVEDLDLVGIVTMSDVVWHFNDVVREAHAIDEQRDTWESNDLLDEDVDNLIGR